MHLIKRLTVLWTSTASGVVITFMLNATWNLDLTANVAWGCDVQNNALTALLVPTFLGLSYSPGNTKMKRIRKEVV